MLFKLRHSGYRERDSQCSAASCAAINWVITAAHTSQRADRSPKYLPHQWLLCRWTLGPALCVSSSWLGRFPLPRPVPMELLPAHVQRRVRWARSRAQCAQLLRPYLADRLREHNAKYHFLESNLHFKQKKISKNPRCIVYVLYFLRFVFNFSQSLLWARNHISKSRKLKFRLTTDSSSTGGILFLFCM